MWSEKCLAAILSLVSLTALLGAVVNDFSAVAVRTGESFWALYLQILRKRRKLLLIFDWHKFV
jgi:hypothetical protein